MDFTTTAPKLWLKEAEVNVTENLAPNEWFILNIQETGMDLNIYTLCFCVHVCICVCVCVRACTVHMQWTIFKGIL
jgi:hypothetical protein